MTTIQTEINLEKQRDWSKSAMARLREERKAKNICIYCQAPLPPRTKKKGGHVCVDCLDKRNTRQKAAKKQRLAEQKNLINQED